MTADIQTIRYLIHELSMIETQLKIQCLKEAKKENHLEAARFQERAAGVSMAFERLSEIEFEETQRIEKVQK
jgi:hypothetical protein